MADAPPLRIAPDHAGVSIWSPPLFGGEGSSQLRNFLARVFTVEEVRGVEIRRTSAFGRVRYLASANPSAIWRKLSTTLRVGSGDRAAAPPQAQDIRRNATRANDLFLDAPANWPVVVSRFKTTLSTWRISQEESDTLRIGHPVLRRHRDIAFRLEEQLASIFGVQDFRTARLGSTITVQFDPDALTAEQLAGALETAWPQLLDGIDGPPSSRRLVAAGSLLGLAFAGQYMVPALRPLAVAGVALYSLPNVVTGAKQLSRREVGLPALYSTGLAFMLWTGMPFTATVMAVFMQFWPRLARQKLIRSQRRLFAAVRRRAVWARLNDAEGVGAIVDVEDLQIGDLVRIKKGEIIPADGVIVHGTAAVDDALAGDEPLTNRSEGDVALAGAIVAAGELTIRVERVGAETIAATVAALLPHSTMAGLPSSVDVERIANRNAKPALALAALSLLLTRQLRPSQAIIRPDYATGPRISAQLVALYDFAAALQQGIVFKRPAALDVLSNCELVVIDDSAVSDDAATGPHPGAERLREILGALKKKNRRLQFAYLSQSRREDTRSLADSLGIASWHADLSADAKAEIIRSLKRRALWVGNGTRENLRLSIAASDVSVSIGGSSTLSADHADVVLLQGGLDALLQVAEIGESHRARLTDDYRTVYMANLIGVAGAFLARFGSLQAGLLSNFATGLIYVRHAGQLSQLVAKAEQDRSKVAVARLRGIAPV